MTETTAKKSFFDSVFSAKDDREQNRFNPLNLEYSSNQVWEDLFHHKFGGRKETIGLLGIGSAILLSTPLLQNGLSETAWHVTEALPVFSGAVAAVAEKIIKISPAVLTAYGAYTLANEVLVKWRKHFLFKTAAKADSSIPPMDAMDKNGLFLGYTTDNGKLIGLPDDSLFRHVTIVGQSGMGKTVAASAMMQQQIQRGGGVLFVDGKLDAANIQAIYQFAVWAGRGNDFYVINPGQPYVYVDEEDNVFDETHREFEKLLKAGRLTKKRNSNTYNPILYGDADEVASRVMSVIPSTEGSSGADFYKQSGNEALTILFGACKAAGMKYNFLDMNLLMNNEDVLNDLCHKLEEKNPDCSEFRSLKMFMDRYRMPSKEGVGRVDMKRMKETLGGISGRMFTFGSGQFGEILNSYEPDVNLYDCIRNGKIIYVALPTMGKDVAATNFAKILLGDLRTAVSWLQRNPQDRPVIPFMVFCDEANSYATESWAVMYEQARSAGVFLMPAIQTDSGLTAVSEEFKERVLGNTVTKIFFRVGTPAAAEMAAENIGKTRRITRSSSFSQGDSASANYIQISPQKSQGANIGDGITEREEEVYLIEPDVLRSLNVGECILSYEGTKIYDLIVPFISLSKETIESIGKFHLNFPQKKHEKRDKNGQAYYEENFGLNYFVQFT